MNPAFSVVFLTTLIGAGQGLFLALFGVEAAAALHVAPSPGSAFYVTGSVIALLTPKQLGSLTSDQLSVMNYQQFDSLAYARKLGLLSKAQVAAIDPITMGSLDKSTITKFSAVQMSAFTADQVAALTPTQIVAIDATDIRSMTAEQIAAMTPAQAAVLTTAQIFNLGTKLIRALSVEALANMSVAQIASLSGSQVANLTMEQADSLVDEQVLALGSKADNLFFSPIVLDLNKSGTLSVSVDNGTRFDLKASGSLLKTGWVESGDGLLAMDRNGDGIINDGAELFGNSTKLANGKAAANGYVALAALDGNRDGTIDAKDAAWSKLKVWMDQNGDGRTDAGELLSMAEVGVASLKLSPKSSSATENGNKVALVSSYSSTDGSSSLMADVWFRTKSINAPEVKIVGTADHSPPGDLGPAI